MAFGRVSSAISRTQARKRRCIVAAAVGLVAADVLIALSSTSQGSTLQTLSYEVISK
jgi:hypothetical protein